MLRKMLLVLVVLSLVLVSAGCTAVPAAAPAAGEQPAQGGEAASTSEGVTLTMLTNFTTDVNRGKVLQSLIDEFNAQQGGKVTVVSNTDPDWPALQQKIKSMIAAGSPPDIFLYNFNANDLSREQSGKLFNFGPALDADPAWKATFRPENLQMLTINGETVGIPSDQAPVVVYYHKDLFDKAGIESFPTTWDEFFAAADKLKASGVAPIALMTADDAWHAMNVFTYAGAGAGGPNVFGVDQPLDSAAIVKAAEVLQKLFSYTTPDAVGANYAVSTRNFLSKKAAMIIDGPWLISSIQGEVADPCNVAVAAAPTFGDDVIGHGFLVTDSVNPWAAAKPATPAGEQALVDWMKFLTSEPSVKRFAIEGDYPLAVKANFTDEDKSKLNCQMAQILDLSNQAPVTVVEAVRNIKPAAQAELPGLLEGLALGQLTPQDFATQLQNANK